MLIFGVSCRVRIRTVLAASLFTILISIHAWPQDMHVSAATARFPELQPIAEAVELASVDGPIGFEKLVQAAVAFSGTAADPAAATQAILAHARRFKAQSAGRNNQRALAEGALQYLHERILTRYSERATSVDEAVRTGQYNCVSSAVLYAILTRAVGLDVAGVRTRDHAFVSVTADGSPIDVETTNVYGFEPGKKKQFTDSFGSVTGFSYVPPSNYRDRTTIPLKELLALILYNRASEAGQDGRYREGVNPAVSSFVLAGTSDFREAMRAAVSNYSTFLAMRGDFGIGLAFLAAVEEARGAEPDLARLRMEITHNQAISLVERGLLDEADALLAAPGSRAALGDSDWMDLSIYVVQARAQEVARRSGDAAASETVAVGLKTLGSAPELLRMYEAYVHNAFARLYNARRMDEARAALARGLEVHPSSATLASDMASLTAHR
jgi:hypothetical protein